MLDNNEIGIGITLMTNNICHSYKYKEKEKVYVEYGINDMLFNKVNNNNKIFIRELLPNKNSIKEAKSLKCNYILNKKGKLIKIRNIINE